MNDGLRDLGFVQHLFLYFLFLFFSLLLVPFIH